MGQRILIVEDDVELRAYAAQLLLDVGYEVFELGDAEQIVQEARQRNVDLILLDYRLPGIDGLMALRLVRSSMVTLPVVMMTADINPQVILQCFRTGADDFIAKPFDVVYLKVIIERALDRASNNLKNSVFRLMQYARHKDECAAVGSGKCMCGLQEAIQEAVEATRTLKES